MSPKTELLTKLAEYVENVPDDRGNCEHLDRQTLLDEARELLNATPWWDGKFGRDPVFKDECGWGFFDEIGDECTCRYPSYQDALIGLGAY